MTRLVKILPERLIYLRMYWINGWTDAWFNAGHGSITRWTRELGVRENPHRRMDRRMNGRMVGRRTDERVHVMDERTKRRTEERTDGGNNDGWTDIGRTKRTTGRKWWTVNCTDAYTDVESLSVCDFVYFDLKQIWNIKKWQMYLEVKGRQYTHFYKFALEIVMSTSSLLSQKNLSY